MDINFVIDLIKLTKCYSEGRCILSSVVLRMKVKYATDALFLLLQHEHQLLKLMTDLSSHELKREVQSLGSILKYSFVLLRKRLLAMMHHISQLLFQVHSNLSSLKSYYEQNLTIANELTKLGLNALGDAKRKLFLGEKRIFDDLNSLLLKATAIENPSSGGIIGSVDRRRSGGETDVINLNNGFIDRRSSRALTNSGNSRSSLDVKVTPSYESSSNLESTPSSKRKSDQIGSNDGIGHRKKS